MLKRATKIASMSTCTHRHGAIITKGGRVLAVGVGFDRNDPRNVENPKRQAAVHAEVAAIRACAGASLKGATIYVARRTALGTPAMSKPCVNCEAAIRAAGITKVFYTVEGSMVL